MYTPTIGLEVHAELKTKSKMFCGCKNDPHASEPNSNICPICMAHPGTLPVANSAAIKSVLKFGIAVGGELADYSEFDRKNYFYPDIPKAYQLSQYAFPFVKGGELSGVALTRVHLEEDTARSQHDKGEGSLVDYNRAGVPLMELVTEPVMHDATTVGNFAKELQLLLRTLEISDANMEKGEMRVEANISVSNTGQKAKTYVEVKNLNSFKAVEGAINYEIKRQTDLIESGGQVLQETRGWDENKQETYLQRSKETAKDYRYFPDPDLPKYKLSDENELTTENLRATLPVLPTEKRSKYAFLGLTSEQIETVIQSRFLDCYVAKMTQAAVVTNHPQAGVLLLTATNYLLTDLVTYVDTDANVLEPDNFLGLIDLLLNKKVTSRVVKDMLKEFANNNTDLVAVVMDRNLMSDFSAEALIEIAKVVVANNEKAAAEYQAGKDALLQFLVGQAMKATKGAADPLLLQDCFIKLLPR